eukprot:TRINITY_DN544_c0_g1_i3.p2 TRINITY_DN544_c0_g1~~TRINITY_DN544_c0_g1_i3.p2  ORF type:complete len:238 (+),score=62.96 TRINITY_DN544_c0_g1_i3:264-977(+)
MRARKNDRKKTITMIEATTKWRNEFKPEQITPDAMEIESQTAKLYQNGITRDGMPVVYMRPGRDILEDNDRKLKHLVYNLERAQELLPVGKDKMCWIIDFKGFSSKIGGISNIKMSMATLDVLQNHYPERLGLAVLLNAPMMFSFFWKVVSPFIDPETKKKIVFLDNKKMAAFLTEKFEPEQYEAEYGGTLPGYDHALWMEKERADFASKKDRREQIAAAREAAAAASAEAAGPAKK